MRSSSMANKQLFSIIIPVYNTSKYLRRCLESVLAQTNPHFEVVVIDDGSTDSSPEICDEYSSSDSRFHVIHTPNQGQLAATLCGTEHSHGEWLLYLDSDDYWDISLLEVINETVSRYQPDMVLFRMRKVSCDEYCLGESPSLFPDATIFTTNFRHDLIMKLTTSTELNSLAIKAVRKQIVQENMRNLPRIRVGEDLLKSISFILPAKKVVYRDITLYNYRQNMDSCMNSPRVDDCEDFEEVLSAQYSVMQHLGFTSTEDELAFCIYALRHTISECVVMSRAKLANVERKEAYLILKARVQRIIAWNDTGLQHLSRRESSLLSRLVNGKWRYMWLTGRIQRYIREVIWLTGRSPSEWWARFHSILASLGRKSQK